jgi:hypothetical protein
LLTVLRISNLAIADFIGTERSRLGYAFGQQEDALRVRLVRLHFEVQLAFGLKAGTRRRGNCHDISSGRH